METALLASALSKNSNKDNRKDQEKAYHGK